MPSAPAAWEIMTARASRISSRKGRRSLSCASASSGRRGREAWVSSAARPRPGKCLRHPPTPRECRPSRKSRAAARTSSAEPPADRSPRMRSPAPGTARSTTGARSTEMPKCAQISPASSPARRAWPLRAARRSESEGPSIAWNRSTVPPSWSTQRKGGPGSASISAISSSSCSSVPRLRAKRITARGGYRSRIRRSGREREVPSKPAPKSRELNGRPSPWIP